jgi:energy-coupling factor transport system ATP-binding protein
MIKAQNLSFRYNENSDFVIKDLTFEIEAGSFTAVLGRNGSGKSTLAKLFGAILFPSSGSIIVDTYDTSDDSRNWNIRQTVGMVFQNPDNQIVSSIVEEDVAFGLENIGVPSEEMRQRVDDALKAVGMSDFAQHSPHQLSGGQKQRVAIAGIIAMRPKVIILDEATAMLDTKGREEVLETVHNLREQYGITVILITHYMEEALKATRVLVVDGGKIILDGKPDTVFKNKEKIIKAGLELPVKKQTYKLPADFNSCNGYIHIKPDMSEYSAIPPIVAQTCDLCFTYSKGTPFEKTPVKDMSIKVSQGEFVGVIGNTGSGKSTLMSLVAGLLKPESGQVIIDGVSIWQNSKKKAKKVISRDIRFKLGFVFQYPEYQLFADTVWDDIAFGAKNMGLTHDEISARVAEVITLCGLQSIAETAKKISPFELSGGQKRRVAIAGVLVMQPQILILDEPTAGLDPEGKRKILALIKAYQESRNATVFFISHNLDDVFALSTSIICLKEYKHT